MGRAMAVMLLFALAGGFAVWAPDTERQMSIREAFNLAEAKFGTLGATGSYNTPKDVHGEYRGGTIGASPAYSFTAHVAEVEVDVETGMVKIKWDGPKMRSPNIAAANKYVSKKYRKGWELQTKNIAAHVES